MTWLSKISVDGLINNTDGLFVYLDIYCDGAVKGLKERRGHKGSEPNWRESEMNKRKITKKPYKPKPYQGGFNPNS